MSKAAKAVEVIQDNLPPNIENKIGLNDVIAYGIFGLPAVAIGRIIRSFNTKRNKEVIVDAVSKVIESQAKNVKIKIPKQIKGNK